MADFEVHIDLNGRTRQVGLARSNRVRGKETVLFEYAERWLDDPGRFSLQPALAMTRGAFVPPAGQSVFGSIGDSAPDTWGRRLMQRAERRSAEREGCGGDCDLARYRQKNRCAACRNQPHGQRLRA